LSPGAGFEKPGGEAKALAAAGPVSSTG